MSELKMISPLLDGMTLEKAGPSYDGRNYYTLRDRSSGEQVLLKVLSIPSSDSHVRALILSGAYPDEASVNEYYRRYTEDIRRELKQGKELASTGFFAGALDFQVAPRDPEVGFDIYILLKRHVPLSYLLNENAITDLRAINLGIDICDALIACREAGFLFTNLTPESIYLTPSGKFLLGDLGLIELEDLQYSSVPEEYIGAYSAPELSDITESPNPTIDLYSLGMVLFRIYNGNHGPFEDENTGEGMADKLRLTGKPLPTPIYADYELAGIIQKACSFQKEDRFQTPEELKNALILYMQRNEISDKLVVPPIVVNFTPPVDLPEEEEEQEPIRMTSEDKLDETFRRSFAPDLSGAGSDEYAPSVSAGKDIADPEEGLNELNDTSEEEASEEAIAETPVPLAVPAAEPATDLSAEAEDYHPLVEDTGTIDEADAEVYHAYKDPDQIDIDSLLASISDVIGDKDTELASDDDMQLFMEDELPEEVEEYPEEVPAPEEDVKKKSEDGLRLHFEDPASTQKKPTPSAEEEKASAASEEKRSKTLPIIIILGLVLAIALVGFFLIRWFFVEVSALNITSLTTDELVVQLVTDDSIGNFTLTCTDSNGKIYFGSPVAGQYRFSGLDESKEYVVTIEAAGMHRLKKSSVSTYNVTTPDGTHISEFSVSRGDNEGDLLVTFLHEGPTPDLWTLSYTNADGSIANDIQFEGNACNILGLTVGQTYTFSLEKTQGIHIKDQYSLEYELLPFVEVLDLTVSQINEQVLTLSWKSGENIPEEWIVICTSEGIEPMSFTVTESICEIPVPDLSRDYEISVYAKGMDASASLTLPANPIIVEDLSAAVDDNGAVVLSWQTPAGTPAGGWYVSYNTVGSLHYDYILGGENTPITENSVTIPNLIPEANYRFSLKLTSADASEQLFGITEIEFTTPDTGAFDEFGIQPAAPIDNSEGYISLWPVPDFEGWIYADLRNRKNEFTAEEKIAVCVELNFQTWSDREVHLRYAVRDSEGNVVNDVATTVVWDDMWYRRRHASAIPMPVGEDGMNIPGEYTLELYLDGKLFAFIDFTIV